MCEDDDYEIFYSLSLSWSNFDPKFGLIYLCVRNSFHAFFVDFEFLFML